MLPGKMTSEQNRNRSPTNQATSRVPSKSIGSKKANPPLARYNIFRHICYADRMMSNVAVLLHPNQKVIHRLLILAYTGSILTVLIGFLCLLSWQYNILFFKDSFPFTAFMNPLSAVGFICSGCSLFILLQQSNQEGSMKPVMHYLALILSSITTLIGLLMIVHILGFIHDNPDQLLYSDKLSGNRISPNSSINHFFIGIALLCLQFHTTKYFTRIAQILTLLVAIISMFAVMGYSYNALSLYKVAYLAPMPLSSALTFSIICISLLFAKSDHGITKILTRNTSSSTLALRLIIITLTVPAALAYLFLLGEQMHWYTMQTEIALVVIWNIILLTSIIWMNTRTIQHIELENVLIKNELEQKNIKLKINAEDLAVKTLSLEEKNKEITDKLDVRDKLFAAADAEN